MTPKKFLQDKTVLFLLSISIFLTVLTIVLILLRLGGTADGSYIAQYRPNLGLDRYRQGSVTTILSFIAFSVLVTSLHTIISLRVYQIRRQLSLTVLGLGILLLTLSLIVSNALLVLVR